jgi:hypothetical protein
MKKLKQNIRDWGATIAGFIAAGLTGWQSIDWGTFDINRDKYKLAMMFIIAAGGTFSKFKKTKKDGKDVNNNS